MDLGATDHIAGKLDKLTMHDRYCGSDQVRAANGTGMHINLIGHFVIPTPYHSLHLKNALHVYHAHKHLVYVHQFNLDNHTFIELHPHCFLIKDQVMRKVLLRGPCSRVVSHPIPPSTITSEVCHVIKDNNLSCSGFENNGSVCDVCMKAKAHQLPYPVSTSRASTPLELIFSDVWGPAINSFGGKNYYVSFIDDFSKFT
jgi:hypothetical protein